MQIEQDTGEPEDFQWGKTNQLGTSQQPTEHILLSLTVYSLTKAWRNQQTS